MGIPVIVSANLTAATTVVLVEQASRQPIARKSGTSLSLLVPEQSWISVGSYGQIGLVQ
jgi:hypothetical protein